MATVKNVHKNITIEGKVQGVGFRYTAKTMALSLGVKGFVKNLTNGSVYIEAEGSEVQLKHLIDWCRRGPSYAYVDEVRIENADIKGFDIFEISH